MSHVIAVVRRAVAQTSGHPAQAIGAVASSSQTKETWRLRKLAFTSKKGLLKGNNFSTIANLFFALVVLNCFVSNQHCFSIRSYLFSENAELFGKVMTSPGKFSSDETFMSTCTCNRLATPCPLTLGIQIYFSPPLVISLVKSSMLLMAHFNSCTNNIIQYTTSELQQICHRLLGDINNLMWMTLP